MIARSPATDAPVAPEQCGLPARKSPGSDLSERPSYASESRFRGGRSRVGARTQPCARVARRWPQPFDSKPVSTGRGLSPPASRLAAPPFAGAISPNERTGASGARRKRGPVRLSGPPIPANRPGNTLGPCDRRAANGEQSRRPAGPQAPLGEGMVKARYRASPLRSLE